MKTKLLLSFTLALSLCFFFTQCKKIKFKSNCCTHSINISPDMANDSMAIYAPNAFTPDADGLNDVYTIKFLNVKEENFYLRIYQKRKTFFETCDQNFGWNGDIDGRAKEGIYSYDIEGESTSGKSFTANGNFCLLYQEVDNGTRITNCSSCSFPDMIDPSFGFIYQSREVGLNCKE